MQIKKAWVVVLAAAALAVAGCSSSGSGGSGSAGSTPSGSSGGSSQQSTSGGSSAAGAANSAGSSSAASAGPSSAAGSGSAGAAGASCTLADPVKVGVVFTLTGAAAQYGATQKNGVELAADQLNAQGGVKYNLDIQDSQTNPKQAISIFQKFISDGDSIIIGPTLSNSAKQTDPIAQQAKIPVLGVSNTTSGITSIGNYIWRDSLTEDAVIPNVIKLAKSKYNLKHVVLMYANDEAFSEGDFTAFKAALDANGITIDKTLTFSTNDTDFRSLLAEAKSSKPDALVVGALIGPAVSITTQARQLGMTMPIIGGNGFNSPALMKQAGSAANGVVVGAAWNIASTTNQQSVDFIKAYHDKYGSDPDQFAAQAYTGMEIVNQAVRIACSADRDAIRDALGKVKDLATPLGTFNFTPERDASHEPVVQLVQDGKFTVLS